MFKNPSFLFDIICTAAWIILVVRYARKGFLSSIVQLVGNLFSLLGAKELSAAGANTAFEQIVLAVGLPPEHYGMLRERFAQYFRRFGTVNFAYNNRPMSIVIRNVFVYPQAYAAVVPQSGQLLKTLRMFIVDIGGYTTDVLLLRNGKPDLQFRRSLESGVITMNNHIIGKISAQHDMRIEDEHICAVLQGQETILPDEVKKAIRDAAQLHAKDILASCVSFRWICVPIPPSLLEAEASCSDR